jgi:NADPH-dependent 2,4-dienoyl-CoA reductase/sulfur reductase-like enzyme
VPALSEADRLVLTGELLGAWGDTRDAHLQHVYPAWLESSGLSLDNGVVCDASLFTGAEGVYAAGDVARWHNPAFDRPMRLEHWTSAAEQGALAARNALDPAAAKPYVTVPYFLQGAKTQHLR